MAVSPQQQYGPPQTPYPGPTPLEDALRLVVRRMRLLRWVRCASFGALVGEVVSIAAVLLAHFDLLPDWLMLEAFIPLSIAIGIATGTVFALIRPIDLMAAARIAETRLGLKERLSSALEFSHSPSTGGGWRDLDDPVPTLLVQLQQRDAAAYAGVIRPKDAVPFRWPWQLKALIAATAVLIIALVVPNLPMFVSPADRAERGIVTKEGQKLAQQATIIQKIAETQQLPHTKWAAQQMHRLAQQMTRGHMNKRQAFVKYGRLTQQMQQLQKQLSQNGSAEAAKSLNAAGRQLAQSLQSQTNPNSPQNGADPHSSQDGQGGKGGSSANGTSKTGAGAKNGQGQHGFNIPGPNTGGGQNNGSPSAAQHATNEMRQAAKAMQQGDGRGLSQQLRDLARRVASNQMSQDDKQQAQQDLQKLSDALQGTSMKQTQQHAQAAADAMKQGDTQRAADEMKKAADSAEREMKDQQDKDAVRDAQNSLQRSQSEMAGASSPSDIGQGQQGQQGQSGDSGNSGESGQGDSSGESGNGQGQSDGSGERSAENELKRQGAGQGQNGQSGNDPGEENGGSGSANRAGHGNNHGGKSNSRAKWAKFQGPPGRLNPNFDPSKFPKYNKIYLGKPHGGAQGELGKTMKTRPGAGGPHPVSSQVPYYNYVGPAKQAAEHAVDHEDIPPSYKDSVQKYFDSLTPSQR